MTRGRLTVAQDGPQGTSKKKTTRTVRTTMEPDRTYEVDEHEYETLRRQGLIKEGK
jgi:hypothetical protein